MGVMNRKMVKIDPSVAKTSVRLLPPVSTATGYSIEIYRMPLSAGGVPLVAYEAFEVSGGELVFFWDESLYALPSGQYAGVIKYGCSPCDTINISLGGCSLVMDSTNETYNQDACSSLDPGQRSSAPTVVPQAACTPDSLLCEGATISQVEEGCTICGSDSCTTQE